MALTNPQGQAIQIVNTYMMPDGTLEGFAYFRLCQGSPTKFGIDMMQFHDGKGHGDKGAASAVVQSFIYAGFTYDGTD